MQVRLGRKGSLAALICLAWLSVLLTSTLLATGCSSQASSPQASSETQPTAQNAGESTVHNFLGADLNTYPGDEALPILRKSFSFLGYWLSNPPDAKENNWIGKREQMRSQGFGFALLYLGPQSNKLKSATQAKQKGSDDAKKAVAAASKEGFPSRSIVFLDVEEGGRLPAAYHVYLQAWTDQLVSSGYRAGVYCSGMPVSEGGGVTIVTADDIRANLGQREMEFWVFNDACPPSPGCVTSQSPPAPAASGVAYASIWQISQSPRRKQFTVDCSTTYNRDGNCYAPEDNTHNWFLDVDVATSPNPSSAR